MTNQKGCKCSPFTLQSIHTQKVKIQYDCVNLRLKTITKMSLNTINPTETKAWAQLKEHFAETDFDLKQLFTEDKSRFSEFSIQKENLLLIFQKPCR